MPIVTIVTNQQLGLEAKRKLASDVTTLFSQELKKPKEHVHVHINDGQFLSFGGDADSPAVYMIVKTSEQQIKSETRKELMVQAMPVLQDTLEGLSEHRTTTYFEEFPVENIAVGTNIMVFASSAPGTPKKRDTSFD